jgi:hypothetical protein
MYIFQHPIKCPKCNLTFNHIQEIKKIKGNDSYEAPWPGKGDLIVITFWCENIHTWELCFGEHKGQIFSFKKILTL